LICLHIWQMLVRRAKEEESQVLASTGSCICQQVSDTIRRLCVRGKCALMKSEGPNSDRLSRLLQECFLRIAQTMFLARVIRYFAGGSGISYKDACLSAGGVVGCTVLFISVYHPMMFFVRRLGMRLRTSCCSLMYQKVV